MPTSNNRVDISTTKVFENCKKWLKDSTTTGIKLYARYKHYFPYDKRYDKIYQLYMEFDTPVMEDAQDTFLRREKLRYAHINEVEIDLIDLSSAKSLDLRL